MLGTQLNYNNLRKIPTIHMSLFLTRRAFNTTLKYPQLEDIVKSYIHVQSPVERFKLTLDYAFKAVRDPT